MAEHEPTREAQIEILKSDLTLWVNTRFMWENRLKSLLRSIKLGLAKEEHRVALDHELEVCQANIDFFENELAILEEADANRQPEHQNGKELLTIKK